LGNCLLPWARAIVFARCYGIPMIAPGWVQPRLGALIRNESRKRFYIDEFVSGDYVTGIRRLALLATARRVPEENLQEFATQAERPTAESGGGKNRIFVFQGLKEYFLALRDHRQLITRELLKIVNPFILQRVSEEANEPFIAVHLRRGDLTNQGHSKTALMTDLRYTPDEWFMRAIEAVRGDNQWSKLPIKVFSDGSREEVSTFVNMPGITAATVGSAIGDIFMMAKAALLIASGHSTFSMWASFLGRMPTIYYPARMQQRVQDGSAQEMEWTPGQALPSGLDRTDITGVQIY
jgi:hypothetical protein